MKKDYLVIDFEFTQYRKSVGRPRGFLSEIIEIGAVKVEKESLETVAKIEAFVKPHFYPKQAKDMMAFCSITDEDMKNAISFADMMTEIEALYVPGETWFVAWGKEDYKVLENNCKRHQRENPILPTDYLDLAQVCQEVKGLAQTPGLVKFAREMEIDGSGHWHAAYEDAVCAAKILIKLIEDGLYRD